MKIAPVRNFKFNSFSGLKNTNNSTEKNKNLYSSSLLPSLSNVNLNISFGLMPKPIYDIYKDGITTKYQSQTEAAKKLGISPSQISSILSGKSKAIHGHTFVYASDIEKEDENGNIILNEDKIKEALKKIEPEAIYDINNDGTCIRYENKTEAASALGITQAQVSEAISDKCITECGHKLVYAHDIEKEDKNGNIILDKDKIQKALKKFEPIYDIDKDGIATKYQNQTEAAKELGINSNIINAILSGKNKTAYGHTFAYASDIEKEDNNGNIIPDEDKIQELFEKSRERKTHTKPIYDIYKNGIATKYQSQTEAAKKLGISLSQISLILLGKSKAFQGHTFAYASDIEKEDENGNIIPDEDKIKEALKKIEPEAIYAINENRIYTRYKNAAEASSALGIHRSWISSVLAGNVNTVRGYTFIYASNIEKEDENGNIVLDEDKIQEAYKALKPTVDTKSDLKTIKYAYDMLSELKKQCADILSKIENLQEILEKSYKH